MKNFLLNEGYNNLENLFTSGKGSEIYINNKKYLDLSLSAGSNLLGHNSKIFKKSINEILRFNISNFAAKNKYAVDYAKTLKKILPNYSKFIFCNSGTEAVIKSLRIARAVTKKKIIISVSGSWHGSVNELLYTNDKKFKNVELSGGLELNFKKNLKIIPYNNIDLSKKILDKYKKKIMCVIIEPVQGCLPAESKKFLKFLDNYCRINRLIFIFDEMITGLRFNCSSVQDQFNLNPSISTFGKCFGGGLPIGVIAIKKNIFLKINNNKKKVFFGGTFSGNSITTYVSNKIVKYIYDNKVNIFKDLEEKGKYIEKKINSFFENNNIDAKCHRFSSMIRIVFTNKIIINRSQRDFFEKKNKSFISYFKNYLFDNKIYYPNSGIIFLATSTNYNQINFLIRIIKKAFKEIIVKKIKNI